MLPIVFEDLYFLPTLIKEYKIINDKNLYDASSFRNICLEICLNNLKRRCLITLKVFNINNDLRKVYT